MVSDNLETNSDQACKVAADFFRVLGEPTRLKILMMLLERDLTVSEIADRLQDSLPAVSQRLTMMKARDIIAQKRDGRFTICSLTDPMVKDFVKSAILRAEATV